ncbi:MAG: hypothetical protein GY929_13200 [Actinomycetia bacterium]|nr:hypothetical protein [Actinomycetes bacterium]
MTVVGKLWGFGVRPVALLASLTVAAASAVALGGPSPDGLGAGQASIIACDLDGFTVTHVLSGSTVTDIVVGDIHADCGGGDLSVTLTDAGGAIIGSGGPSSVPGPGGSVSVPVSPTPEASAISEHRMKILGP